MGTPPTRPLVGAAGMYSGRVPLVPVSAAMPELLSPAADRIGPSYPFFTRLLDRCLPLANGLAERWLLLLGADAGNNPHLPCASGPHAFTNHPECHSDLSQK